MQKYITSISRRTLERLIPQVTGKSSLARRNQIDNNLKIILAGRNYWFLMIPFNQSERQIFLHITPDINVTVRMTYIKKRWVVSLPKVPESMKGSIWYPNPRIAGPS